MPIVVQKYGGSSVADVTKIGKVADKVAAAKRAGHDVVVVVSAMGKTTDELLALAKSAAATASVPTDPPRRELDMLLSTGERVTMALLSIAISARGFDAISFTGSQSGIMTNDRHFDARIIEVRPHRIEDELARGKIVIVAGYQGMSYRREITTLGRGGSDTTAVALAAALGAEQCEIYSDVDGVYSADPRVVPEPKHLPSLDLATLQEMAEAGAKVINAQAVEWARKSGVRIVARRTSDQTREEGPTTGGIHARETVIEETTQTINVRAVVGLDRVVFARLAPERMVEFVDRAASLHVPLFDVAWTRDHASCQIPLLNLPDWEGCRSRLLDVPSVKLDENMALVSVVGEGLTASFGAVPHFLRALAEAFSPPIAWTGNPLRLTATVEAARRADCERALHREFVELGKLRA